MAGRLSTSNMISSIQVMNFCIARFGDIGEDCMIRE
jgi:hypothetical protein